MKKTIFLWALLVITFNSFGQGTPIITMIADGDETGGTPKVLEIYANGTVDFSNYALEKQANGGSWGSTYSLGALGVVTDGFVYVYKDGNLNGQSAFALNFPSVTASQSLDVGNASIMSINGDDGIRIVDQTTGDIIDTYGENGVDGTGTVWEYKDGFSKRIDQTGPDPVFNDHNWIFNNGALNGNGAVQNGEIYESIIGIGTYQPAAAVNCNAIIPNYLQDFSSYLPDCWQEARGNVNNLNYTNGRWTNDGFLNQGTTGAARIYMYGTSQHINDWLISPGFDLSSAGNYELSFKVGITGFSNTGGVTMGQDDLVKLMYSTDGGNTWADFMWFDDANNPSNIGDYYAFDLSNYAGIVGNSSVKFAFYANTGSTAQAGYNFYVDDFAIVQTGCPAPTELYTIITGDTSAILNWGDNTGGTAAYYIEWKPVNSTVWNNDTTAAGATSYNLSGLTPDTEYQWRITSVCVDGNGVPVSGNDFIPTCVPIVPAYLQEFTSYLDNCWSEAKGTMTSHFAANSRWTNDGFANNGTTGAARVRLYNNPYDSWLISPEFDLSQGNYTLTMDIAVTKFSGQYPSIMGADDEVNVQVSTDGGATWQVLQVIADANNVPSNQGTQVSIDLSNYNNFARFAIVASDGSNAELAYNFYVDNFFIFNSNIRPANPKVENNLANVNEIKRKDVTIGQQGNQFNFISEYKILNITAYDLSRRPVFKLRNINSNNLQSNINVATGTVLIFQIEMTDHEMITKKVYKK